MWETKGKGGLKVGSTSCTQRGLSKPRSDFVPMGKILCPREELCAHEEDIVHMRKTMHVGKYLLGMMYFFCTHESLLAAVGVWKGVREL